MDSSTLTKHKMPIPSGKRILMHSIPLIAALLTIGIIYYLLSAPFAVGPSWLILGIIIPLMLILVSALYRGKVHITRTVGFVLLGVITLAEATSTSALIIGLLTSTNRLSDLPHDTALVLLRDGALIWLVNILTFALWYWEVDSGGPACRLHLGYHSTDFIFPQVTLEMHRGEQPWIPHFVDYMFLAFNTSTAFSPTDTQVLSVRIKLLMMLQALISLTVLAIIAARAINTL
jgi:hypothetical protein